MERRPASSLFPLDQASANALEDALKRMLPPERHPREMAASARYVLGWEDRAGRASEARGKRTRPAICIAVCRALGGSLTDALPGAVAVELVHNFSLVHDEIQDRDRRRHGRPTLWTLIGEAQAINAGDFLYTLALEALLGPEQASEASSRAASALIAAVGAMVGGQWSDLAFEGSVTVSRADYLRMVAGKTGALFGAPVEIGAIFAGSRAETVRRLGDWGRHAGLAFQIQDDYLGIWGDPASTGKSNTNDIARRKLTFPVILGLSNREARRVIEEEYAREDAPDVERVTRSLEGAGAKEQSREAARAYAREASALLVEAGLRDSERNALAGVESALIERDV